MTIAACYVCPEGVVMGADSTATFPSASGAAPGGHYDFTQKLFEIGSGGTLGIVTWGLGGFGVTSYRTLVARLADKFSAANPQSVKDAAWQWSSLVWNEYCIAFADARQLAADLAGKTLKTVEEEEQLRNLVEDLSAGFCIGGCCGSDRQPEAYEVWVRPTMGSPAQPSAIAMGNPKFWGWSNLIDRLFYGMDDFVFRDILISGHWKGTAEDLRSIAAKNKISPYGALPIREAIDWVHASIYTTIKGFKFSRLDPVCGGRSKSPLSPRTESFGGCGISDWTLPFHPPPKYGHDVL